MITISNTATALKRFFEATAKARVNSVLLQMGRKKVEEMGFSYEALRAGPSAWPWRKATQDGATAAGIGVQLREFNETGEIAPANRPGASHGIERDAA